MATPFQRMYAAFLLLVLLVSAVQAIDLQKTDIRALSNGDAEITMHYSDNPAEYLGIKAFAASPSAAMEKIIGPVMSKNGQPLEVHIDCVGAGVAQVTVTGFADRQGDTYWTPEITLGGDAVSALQAQSMYPLDLSSEVMIVFPDGFAVGQGESRVIGGPPTMLSGGKPIPPRHCRQAAKTKRTSRSRGSSPMRLPPWQQPGSVWQQPQPA
jgi:hypothetical protein